MIFLNLTYQYLPVRFSEIYLPIIPVLLKHEEKEVILGMLVDSGADYCIITRGIAKDLGLDIESCPTETTVGIGGTANVRKTDLEMTFYRYGTGFSTTASIRVMVDPASQLPYPLLGRVPVFDLFDVTFRQRKYRVELRRTGKMRKRTGMRY